MVNCPLCDAALEFDEEELDEGDELTCEECGEMVRVSSKTPLELEAVDDGDEDDEDDEEEEEDDDYEDTEDAEDDFEEEEEADEDWR
ncbi:MAG: hypothetical protein ACKV2U_23495 [Bryobacteraceae bacterium]